MSEQQPPGHLPWDCPQCRGFGEYQTEGYNEPSFIHRCGCSRTSAQPRNTTSAILAHHRRQAMVSWSPGERRNSASASERESHD